jgi:hypothetical protein
MTKDVSKKPAQEPPPLKNALSDVLKRNDMKPPQEARTEPQSKPAESSKPYEVPQETLQSIFKEPL